MTAFNSGDTCTLTSTSDIYLWQLRIWSYKKSRDMIMSTPYYYRTRSNKASSDYLFYSLNSYVFTTNYLHQNALITSTSYGEETIIGMEDKISNIIDKPYSSGTNIYDNNVPSNKY